MKLTVLNGSPKGNTSVTMQYVRCVYGDSDDFHVFYVNHTPVLTGKQIGCFVADKTMNQGLALKVR